MGRPKGSKNKPKNIETVETSSKNISEIPSETSVEPVKKKRHRRTKAEMEAYRASLKAQDEDSENESDTPLSEKDNLLNVLESTRDLSSKINSTQEDNGLSTEESDGSNLSKFLQTSREDKGVKNDLDRVEETFKLEEISRPEETPVKPPKKVKVKVKTPAYPLCDCCQQEIYDTPHRIDTNILSAQMAEYFRESPRWVNLCRKCARELSDTVDKWLQEHGCMTRMEQREAQKLAEREANKS